MSAWFAKFLSVLEDIAVLAAGVCFFGAIAHKCIEHEAYWWAGCVVSVGVAIIAAGTLLRWPSMVMKAAMQKAKKMGGGNGG